MRPLFFSLLLDISRCVQYLLFRSLSLSRTVQSLCLCLCLCLCRCRCLSLSIYLSIYLSILLSFYLSLAAFNLSLSHSPWTLPAHGRLLHLIAPYCTLLRHIAIYNKLPAGGEPYIILHIDICGTHRTCVEFVLHTTLTNVHVLGAAVGAGEARRGGGGVTVTA